MKIQAGYLQSAVNRSVRIYDKCECEPICWIVLQTLKWSREICWCLIVIRYKCEWIIEIYDYNSVLPTNNKCCFCNIRWNPKRHMIMFDSADTILLIFTTTFSLIIFFTMLLFIYYLLKLMRLSIKKKDIEIKILEQANTNQSE